MGRLVPDLRFAVRMFARQPTLAAAAVATLALGIGANSAIFSVVDLALLTSPPFREPGRVVVAYASSPLNARLVGVADKFPMSWGDFYEWSREVCSFAQLAMLEPGTMSLAGAGPPLQLNVIRATGGFSAVLGTPAMLGRGLGPGDDLPGKPAAILLSYGTWRRRFGGDAGVIGRKVYLDREPVTVIGVMPPSFSFPRGAEMPAGFGFPAEPDAWVPFCLTNDLRQDHGRMTSTVIGRLRAGVGIASAEQELRVIYGRLARAYPNHQDFSARLLPITEQMVGRVRPALLVLWAAVGLVLLVACANVANLLLARAASRQKEIAVRVAIGAGRGHLVGQLLAESGLLALIGGILGIGVAVLGLRALAAFVPVDLAGAVTGSLDSLGARVLAFTGLLCAATSVLAGLLPALQATRPDLVECLREGTRAGAGIAGSRRTRDALVVAELALSLLLLAGAGLLLRSFARLLSVDPGFRAAHVLTFDVNLPPGRMTMELRRQFYARVVERLRALPGVAAAAINDLPLSGGIWISGWEIEGRPKPVPADLVAADARVVTPDYFAVMDIPLHRGRLLAAADERGAMPVAVIDDAMARTFWPGRDPLGKRIRFWGAKPQADDPEYPWTTVVGVVGSVHYDSLEARPRIELYRAMAQASWVAPGMTFVVRSAGDPAALAAAARTAVREVDRDQPIAAVRTLERVVADSVAPRRFTLLLLGIFAALALVLAAVGVYGVTYCSVVQRTRELGLRMALGAQPRQLLRLLAAEAGILVALGLAIGLAAAFVLTRAMSSLLYGVGPADPATYAGGALVLTLAALLAAWLPGRRATRLDPMTALRGD